MNQNLELARLFQERVHTYHEARLLDEEHDLKKDWRTFSYILSTLPITALYHITDSRNVPSIFEHGCLMSSNALSFHVWRAMSKPEDNANYVHLSFCPHVSVFRELKKQEAQPVQLTIDPIAALLQGTKFLYCSDPSTRQYYGDEKTESLLRVNFDAELQALNQDLQERAKQFELEDMRNKYLHAAILVPNKVPSFLIKDIKLL